ncbi:MAG: hypothetical protein ABUM26_02595 [Solirubrobacterales bacterium]
MATDYAVFIATVEREAVVPHEQSKPRQVQIREGDTGEASDSGTGSGS